MCGMIVAYKGELRERGRRFGAVCVAEGYGDALSLCHPVAAADLTPVRHQ